MICIPLFCIILFCITFFPLRFENCLKLRTLRKLRSRDLVPLTLVIMITIIVMIIIIIIIIIIIFHARSLEPKKWGKDYQFYSFFPRNFIIKTDFNFFLWENILNFTFLIFMIYMAVLNCWLDFRICCRVQNIFETLQWVFFLSMFVADGIEFGTK